MTRRRAGTIRRLLLPVVLVLYPRAIRDRYGEEVRELLIDSRQPWRDTADAARTAVDERFATLTATQVRGSARWLGKSVRAASLGALAVVPFLIFLVFFPPLAALAGGVVGGILGGAVGRWWWVPAGAGMLLVCGLGLAPATQGAFGGGSAPPAVALWAVGTAALVGLVWRLPRARLRWWTALVGGLVIVHAAAIVQVIQLLDEVRAPREYALGWYWSTIVPVRLNLGGRVTPDAPELSGGVAVPDVLELLPPLMTVVLAFVLALACCARSARETARVPGDQV